MHATTTSGAREAPTTQPDFAAITAKQQATWASGDFAVIGVTLQIVGETLAEAADVRAGERVLDVVAGNRTATLRPHTGLRASRPPTTCPRCSRREKHAPGPKALDVEFQVADAEDLPFRDASFDVVLSTFGVMFTPEHARSAREMLRVLRSGGRIALANWTPEGFIGQLFKVIGGHVRPPAGLASPALWGTEPHIVTLFGSQAIDIRCTRRHFNFRYRSSAHWIQMFRDFYGPTHKAFAALDPDRQTALERDIAALLDRHNVAGNSSLVVPGEYLEVVVVVKQ